MKSAFKRWARSYKKPSVQTFPKSQPFLTTAATIAALSTRSKRKTSSNTARNMGMRRRTGSLTQQIEKNLYADITNSNASGGVSQTYEVYGRRKSNALYKAAQPYQYTTNIGFKTSALQNAQCFSGNVSGAGAIYQACFAALQDNASINDTSRIFVESVSTEYTIQSAVNSTYQLDMYSWVPKLAFPTTSSTFWEFSEYVDGSLKLMGMTNGLATFGMRPFDAANLNYFYRIRKVFPLIMAPGSTHVHRQTMHVNKVLPKSFVDGTAANTGLSLGSIPGFTLGLCLVAHGSPAHDSTTFTNVGVSPVGFDTVIRWTINYREYTGNKKTITNSSNLSTMAQAAQMNVSSPTSNNVSVV